MAKVWSWWTGPRPEYIELCIATMHKQCSEFVLVTDATIPEYLPHGTLHENWRKLEPGVASDCVRAALLTIHGGFWFDTDTIAMHEPGVSEAMVDKDFVYSTWSKPPRRVIAGYCYARRGSELAKAWLAKINHELEHNFDNVGWCTIGEGLLTPLVDSGEYATMEVERSTWLPVDIDAEVTKFFEDRDYQPYVQPWTICYGLNHSYFMSRKPKEMRARPKEMARSPLLIHRLLTYAREHLV